MLQLQGSQFPIVTRCQCQVICVW